MEKILRSAQNDISKARIGDSHLNDDCHLCFYKERASYVHRQCSQHIKEEHVDKFREITIQNAEASRRDEGYVRFDVIQQADDPTRFTFFEMFQSEEAGAIHKETSHFKKWLEQAVPLIVEPRTRAIYRDVSLT